MAEITQHRQPRAPSRSSACGGSAGASAASRPSATSTSRSRPGERRAILGPNGAGKTTLFNCRRRRVPADVRDDRAVRSATSPIMPARMRVGLGLTRTYQTSRLFLGLPVEDNLYLSRASASRAAICGRCGSRGRDRACCGARRGRSPSGSGSQDQLGALVRDLSHGEQRQLEVGMALAGEPKADDARRAGRRPVAGRARRSSPRCCSASSARSRCS